MYNNLVKMYLVVSEKYLPKIRVVSLYTVECKGQNDDEVSQMFLHFHKKRNMIHAQKFLSFFQPAI